MVIEELYIAEKPSVGRAIADNLGGRGEIVRGSKNATHIIVGNKVVTWVFGHILELAEPEDYNPAFEVWSTSASLLPIVPTEWRLKPVSKAKEQLSVIRDLLKRAKVVVHAGDPDREGQLLVDEVLQFLGNKCPVKRILPNAIDDKSMQRVLANVVDNGAYLGLYRSGLGRQRADWLVGINMTRACTAANERGGMRGMLSVGRVQTPTLAMIVRRDLEIDNFKPQTFYDLSATFVHAKGQYQGRWIAPRALTGLDPEGRLLDPAVVSRVKSECEGRPAQVVDYKVEDRRQGAPLPFSLSALQKKASERYKMGAKDVLKICQSLYEKKIASYPRTDSQYLPEEQFTDAPEVLGAIARFDPALSGLLLGANPSLRSAAWNTKKAQPHHAIIPTAATNYSGLTESERKVFELIVKQFLAQFYPDYTYKQTTVTTQCGAHEFRSSGRTPVDLGWRRVFGSEEKAEKSAAAKEGAESEDDQMLPAMSQGDRVNCAKITAGKKLTKPPSHYTEGTLIHAMANVHETVSDPEIKKKLKDVKGLGTEATRADTIETLKDRQFASPEIEKGKLISTPAGRALIAALPKSLTDVTLTALWENALDQIERGAAGGGGMTLEKFLDGQSQWIRKLTREALEMKISVAVGFKNDASAKAASAGAGTICPECKQGTMSVRQAKSGANAGKYFLSCSRYPDCKHSMDIDGQDDPKRGGGRGSKGGTGRKT